MARLSQLILLLLLGVACGEVVPAELGDSGTDEPPDCEQNSDCDGTTPICDEESKTCRGCSTNPECEGNVAGDYCQADSGECVGCLVNSDCGDMTCDRSSFECRPCEAHGDCDSDVCGGAGACVPEANVLYVDNGAPGPGLDCTRSNPCLTTVQAALKFSGDKEWMRVLPGEAPYQDFAVITYDGAKICADGALFSLKDFASAEDVFFRVEPGGAATIIGGTFSDSSRRALSCGTNLNGEAALTVRGATFDSLAGAITGANCNITITDSIVRRSSDTAVQLFEASDQSKMVLKRNRIVEGDVGAVAFQGNALLMHNNLVVGNLTAGEQNGYRLIDIVSAQSLEAINNTIFGNGGLGAISDDLSTAFACSGVEEPPVMANDIVFGNMLSNVFIDCTPTEIVNNILDLKEADQATYPGNSYDPPLLENPIGNDFRPRPNSPAIDSANDSAPAVDIDRNPRNVGEGPDIGAFERQ